MSQSHSPRCSPSPPFAAAADAAAACSRPVCSRSRRRSIRRVEAEPDMRRAELPPLPAPDRRATATHEAPGTIVIDTPNTYLYLVLGDGQAMRYGIGVGREGFTWAGVKTVAKKAEWPDWYPPAEMIARQPYLPRFMAGGPGNPLGARAMYLGGTRLSHPRHQRIRHTIGQRVSSGCIRLTNEDVADLYERVKVGTKVVVLPMSERRAASLRDRQLKHQLYDELRRYALEYVSFSQSAR